MTPGASGSGEFQTDRRELNNQLAAIDGEISSVDKEIENLRKLRTTLVIEREELLNKLKDTTNSHRNSRPQQQQRPSGTTGIDYNESFDWSEAMKARMKTVFGIDSFRLCQEAPPKSVCNANMDNRDIVCVMPTGGGKSLTYQLPALLTPGCTLVISPLISLITDQIIHLQEAGVEAVMLTGSTTKEDSRQITASMTQGNGGERDIKLCYVTVCVYRALDDITAKKGFRIVQPEKISKSKTFVSVLEKMASKGRLGLSPSLNIYHAALMIRKARIVIDEAHCVSQLGHDFRPDYKKLSLLRTLFPRVPILALSATCPPAVLKDLLHVLRLKPVIDGSNASPDGTVYFSAPLYRKNLHYTVVSKPSSATAVIQKMTDYILEHHAHDSGIDTAVVAKGIAETSNGKVKTGVYHADIGDGEKESLHRRWREGKIQVVCATIAFGLGIDMATVRFVLHHSMSKSLDGFYQESGRAGRDGKDADCVLYYRGQDATRLSSLTCGEIGGQEKLYGMLKFAQNVTECRKVLFANYFSASSSLSLASWTSSTAGALTPCGHCDNCTRSPDTIDRKDVTLQSWQILKIMQAIEGQGGRVTLGMMADLIRGAGGGSFGVSSKGGGGGRKGKGKATQGKEKAELDLDEIAGGKVGLNKDDSETLLIHLLLLGYLKEDFHSTAYAINVYLLSGPQAVRLTRLSREAIENGSGTGHRLECVFLVKPSARQSKGKKKEKEKGKAAATAAAASRSKLGKTNARLGDPENASNEIPNPKKRRRAERDSDSSSKEEEVSEEEEAVPGEFSDFIVDDDDGNDDVVGSLPVIVKKKKNKVKETVTAAEKEKLLQLSPSIFISSDNEPVDGGWSFTLRDDNAKRPSKRIRRNKSVELDNEIVISSD